MKKIYALSILFLSCTIAYSQSTCSACNELKQNVVQLTATFNMERTVDGFGYIIGESNQKIYIITAGHVVFDFSKKSEASEIKAKFFFDQGTVHPVKIVKIGTNYDIALLQVPKPEGLTWIKKCYTSDIGDSVVWYIGRNREWWVPTKVSSGVIQQITPDNDFIVDMPNMQPGTSGAPLISKKGFLGIIYEVSNNDVMVYSTEKLKKIITEKWNYPWQLDRCEDSCSVDFFDRSMRKIVLYNDYSGVIRTLKKCIDKNPEIPDFQFFLAFYRCLNVLYLSHKSPQVPVISYKNFPVLICDDLDEYLLKSSSKSKYRDTAYSIKKALYCGMCNEAPYNDTNYYNLTKEDQFKVYCYKTEIKYKIDQYFQKLYGKSPNLGNQNKEQKVINDSHAVTGIVNVTPEQLLDLKTKDGKRKLLEALYGFSFDVKNPYHLKILQNISKQVRTKNNLYGKALDVDTEKLVDSVPLVCRNLADLEIVLQNQLYLYEHERETIIKLWGFKSSATYENDLLLRQVIADYESKIPTSFRTKGVRINMITSEREQIDLTRYTCEDIANLIELSKTLEKFSGMKPGPDNYDLRHIEPSFFPTGGYNIL
jgi:hypothetical protein